MHPVNLTLSPARGLHKEFDDAFASTRLTERPDYAWANEFLLKAGRQMVKLIGRLNSGWEEYFSDS